MKKKMVWVAYNKPEEPKVMYKIWVECVEEFKFNGYSFYLTHDATKIVQKRKEKCGEFAVYEASTGLSVGSYNRSRKVTKEFALEKLNRLQIILEKCVTGNLEKFGPVESFIEWDIQKGCPKEA